MSRFEVNLNEEKAAPTVNNIAAPAFGDYQQPKKKSRVKKVLGGLAISLIAVLIIGAIGGFFYWRHLKTTPQYSLALLVDAARRDDQAEIDKVVDIDAVVDDFVPQITDKAVELYGRGLAPSVISKLAVAVSPYIPAVKKRAKAEIPDLIREKTSKFDKVPFWTIAVGAGRVLHIQQTGDKATVKYESNDRPFELEMNRNGDRWKIVAVKDEIVARRIAEKIGQEIITAAKGGSIEETGKKIGIQNLKDILNNSDIFK